MKTTTAKNHAVNMNVCMVDNCDRPVGKFGDLCCPVHWSLTPRQLRQLLIREQKARESKEKRGRVMSAAGVILLHLNSLKVALP